MRFLYPCIGYTRNTIQSTYSIKLVFLLFILACEQRSHGYINLKVNHYDCRLEVLNGWPWGQLYWGDSAWLAVSLSLWEKQRNWERESVGGGEDSCVVQVYHMNHWRETFVELPPFIRCNNITHKNSWWLSFFFHSQLECKTSINFNWMDKLVRLLVKVLSYLTKASMLVEGAAMIITCSLFDQGLLEKKFF